MTPGKVFAIVFLAMLAAGIIYWAIYGAGKLIGWIA